MNQTYLDCLTHLGVGGAHPGGLQLTKKILLKEKIDKKTFILDAGCGTGQTSAYIAKHYGCNVTSLDYSETMLEKAKQRFISLDLPIEVRQGNTEHLPFNDASFDIVLSESVIAFTKHFLTISEFKRILKQNGLLIAIEMVREQPISEEDLQEITRFYGISTLLTVQEWSYIFQRAGFKSVRIETFDQKFDKNNVENAPDFSFSENMHDTFFEILKEHKRLTNKYKDMLGVRIFRCFV